MSSEHARAGEAPVHRRRVITAAMVAAAMLASQAAHAGYAEAQGATTQGTSPCPPEICQPPSPPDKGKNCKKVDKPAHKKKCHQRH